MPPIFFSDSSRKHGVPEQDQRYAISHAAVVQMIDRDVHAQTDRWVEILVRAQPSGDKKVFHAMELGPKYRLFLEEGNR